MTPPCPSPPRRFRSWRSWIWAGTRSVPSARAIPPLVLLPPRQASSFVSYRVTTEGMVLTLQQSSAETCALQLSRPLRAPATHRAPPTRPDGCRVRGLRARRAGHREDPVFFTLVTGPRRSLSLKLSDTRVYEPQLKINEDPVHVDGPQTRPPADTAARLGHLSEQQQVPFRPEEAAVRFEC